jgi:hypothetical protein
MFGFDVITAFQSLCNNTMQCTVISLSNASRFRKQQKKKCLSGAENVKYWSYKTETFSKINLK